MAEVSVSGIFKFDKGNQIESRGKDGNEKATKQQPGTKNKINEGTAKLDCEWISC